MKTKLICLLLSLVLVFSCFTTAFATSFPDAAASKYVEAIDTIYGLGIINGYPDGTFGANNAITRAEFATLITKSLGYDFDVKSFTQFSDVPANYWASGHIALAASLNIINGYGNGKFGPNDNITKAQAITMMVRAIGYTDAYLKLVNPNATYPMAQVFTALKLNLLTDIDCKDLNVAITRGEVAQLIYNALNIDIASFNAYGINSGVKGDTILSRHAAKATKGCIEFTTNTTLNLINEVGKYGYTYTDAKGKVLATVELSEQLTGYMKNGKFVTDDATYTVAGTTAAAFYNAKNTGSVAVSKIGATYGTNEITLNCEVSGTEITEVYSVVQWVPQYELQLTKSTLPNAKTFSLAGLKFANDGKVVTPFSYVVNGVASVELLEKGDIVNIYVYGGTGNIVRVDVCDDVVSGTVTKITAYPVTYYIDGVAYKSNVPLELGFEYKCYLNAEGVIAKASIIKGINYHTTHYAVINDYGTTLNAKSLPVNYFNGYVDGYAALMQKTTNTDVTIPTAAGLYKVNYVDEYVSAFTLATPTSITCAAVYTDLIKSDAPAWYVISEDVVVYQATALGYTLGFVEVGDELYLYDTSATPDGIYDVIIIK